MVAEDLESPPYPTEGTNADGLYNAFKAMRKWVGLYRAQHNALIGQDFIPAAKALPDKAAYLSQPVMTQWGHLLLIRRLREMWDHAVRTYEDDWDDPDCVRQRIIALQTAAILCNNAFTPHEHREARKQHELAECQRQFDSVYRLVAQQMEPPHREPDPLRGK